MAKVLHFHGCARCSSSTRHSGHPSLACTPAAQGRGCRTYQAQPVQACRECWQRRNVTSKPRSGTFRVPLKELHSSKQDQSQTDRKASDDQAPPDANRALQLAGDQQEHSSLSVKAALAMLGFYRNFISPILPSSCRYLPTCSEYSKDAYVEFGVPKGTVLTAWRLMRCNPWGGRGYDPPVWPPPGLEKIFSS